MKLNTEQQTTLKLAMECEKIYPEQRWWHKDHNDVIDKCIEVLERYK